MVFARAERKRDAAQFVLKNATADTNAAKGKAASIRSSMERYQLVPEKRLRVRARSETLHQASKKVLQPYADIANTRAKDMRVAQEASTQAE